MHEKTIGKITVEYNVTARALRFYEKRGLLQPRHEGMVRLYSGEDCLRLETIIKAKQLGFTLSEIAELLPTLNSGNNLEEKLQPEQIAAQIAHFERQRREIDDAISRLRVIQDRVSPSSTSRPARRTHARNRRHARVA
jgi:DNA-binding transcriptional MerR regulator